MFLSLRNILVLFKRCFTATVQIRTEAIFVKRMVQSGSWIGFDFRRKPAQLYSRGEQKDNKKKKKWLYAGIVMLNMNCWILFLCTNWFQKVAVHIKYIFYSGQKHFVVLRNFNLYFFKKLHLLKIKKMADKKNVFVRGSLRQVNYLTFNMGIC